MPHYMPHYMLISDLYANGTEEYTRAEFAEMCLMVFGEVPDLREDADGNLCDDHGIVLALVG